MDLTARRRRIRKVEGDPLRDSYYQGVNMYNIPPGNSIPLTEFEDLAFERLQLLRILDQATNKGHKPFSEDWKLCVKEDLVKAGLKRYVRLTSDLYSGQSEENYQAHRADHISHFILRLAYCRSEDLRRWFLSREMEWFKLRFLSQSHENVIKFLKTNNFNYVALSEEEKSEMSDHLLKSTFGMTEFNIKTTDFFKVRFTEVMSLVRHRKVFLKVGFAYIPSSQLVVGVQSQFRAKLSENLNIASRKLPLVDDDRLSSLLNNLHNAYTGRDYTVVTDKDAVDPANLDAFSKRHYPMCMRHLHESLRLDHHLKHFSRLQYGLFLKGIGLKYEDAMAFWREEFTKVMDGNKFEKEYAYNIKHAFGKVGQMVSYTPYSCMKIISQGVGSGEHNGCPFKHWDAGILKKKMTEYGISAENVQAVMALASNGHFQIACGKYFESIHGQAASTSINHPNEYFEESVKFFKEKQAKKF